jgi:predicted nucleic acid-binding protein
MATGHPLTGHRVRPPSSLSESRDHRRIPHIDGGHDHEDNLILDLATEVGALIMVSNDTDFRSAGMYQRGFC